MNNRNIVFGALLFLFCGITTAFAAAKLEVYETTFDFGLIPQVCKVSHTYTMKSVGADSLRIISVKPGCGCTKAPLTKEVVAPGDSTEVELIFTSSEAYRGKAQKTATVTCNDDERGSFLLRFSASFNTFPDSAKLIQLAPWNLEVPVAMRAKEQTIVVKNVSASPLSLKLITAPMGFVNVVMPSGEIKPGGTATIKATIDPKCTATAFEKSFTIECSDVETSRITIPVVFGKPLPQTSGH